MNLRPKARAARGPETMRLQLVALIDVVLFILLYFMLATSFASEEGSLSAAMGSDKGGGRGKSNLQPQIVSVEMLGGQPVYRIGSRIAKDMPQLAALLKLLPKQDGVFIKVSGAVPVDSAASAIQAAKDAGFIKVSYVPTK